MTLGPIATAISGASNAFAELTEKVQTGSLEVPPMPEGLEEMPVVGDKVSEVWSQFDRNLEGAVQKYGAQIIEISKVVLSKVAGVGLGLLALALSVIIMGICSARAQRSLNTYKSLQTASLHRAAASSSRSQAPPSAM